MVRPAFLVTSAESEDTIAPVVSERTAGAVIMENLADCSESSQILSERNGPTTSDRTLREYVWGLLYIDEILERDEDKNSDGDTRDQEDEWLFHVQDANWNVVTLCGDSGAVAERFLYDPYGTPSFLNASWVDQEGVTASGNSVLFTGRCWTPLTFTYDYRHREYSPYLGRFLQRDPIGIWGDPANAGNGYGYVGGRPVSGVDPLGAARDDPLLYESSGPGPGERLALSPTHYLRVSRTELSGSTEAHFSGGKRPLAMNNALYDDPPDGHGGYSRGRSFDGGRLVAANWLHEEANSSSFLGVWYGYTSWLPALGAARHDIQHCFGASYDFRVQNVSCRCGKFRLYAAAFFGHIGKPSGYFGIKAAVGPTDALAVTSQYGRTAQYIEFSAMSVTRTEQIEVNESKEVGTGQLFASYIDSANDAQGGQSLGNPVSVWVGIFIMALCQPGG